MADGMQPVVEPVAKVLTDSQRLRRWSTLALSLALMLSSPLAGAGQEHDPLDGHGHVAHVVGPASDAVAAAGGPTATDAPLDAAPTTPTDTAGASPAATPAATSAGADDGHAHDGHAHEGEDPDGISRDPEAVTNPSAADTTTDEAAAHSRSAVEAQRGEPQPTLVVPDDTPAPRRAVPEDRYAMAGGCYAVQSVGTGGFLMRSRDGFVARLPSTSGAEPFHFQATDLGSYLLYGTGEDFLAGARPGHLGDLTRALTGPPTTVLASDRPSVRADWSIEEADGAFRLSLPEDGQVLRVTDDGSLVLADADAGEASRFALRRTTGCLDWPEVEINVSGAPAQGQSAWAETRGYVDAHTHHMAFVFLGGQVHCGRPWHPYGVEYALVDCPDHQLADGAGAVLENFLRDGQPVGQHDPVGWPTFVDWPAPNSLTHEGTYYRWMERSWRGGLRLFVNLLVENNKLCEVYPLKRNSCDDMDSIRLQAQRMREFERYVDAQAGGPGEGFYRIVTDPFEARRVINEGKMAVVMGIETSVVFGCTMKLDIPQCTEAQIERQLDEVHDFGVRQMELVNKFDNALAGVAGDAGTVGIVVNGANFLETGSFWAMKHCGDSAEGVNDNPQMTLPGEVSDRDALFGAIAQEYVPAGLAPLYPAAPHCNQRGLTALGEFTIREMVERNMLFDPDHMSVLARQESLDLVEALDYPGLVSSHSWSTPDAYPRIYEAGGVITPYAGNSTSFVDKWRRHVEWADPRYYFGIGYGADINGLGSQGSPRGTDVDNPVVYPFVGFGGAIVDQQVSGERVYDINADGVAHYGLYPDWIEDLRQVAGEDGDDLVADMRRGAEAYLLTWERALGIANDACREPETLRPVRAFRALDRGTSVEDVLFAVGQPHRRDDTTFTYCAEGPGNQDEVHVRVEFDDDGALRRVTTARA